MILDTHAHLDDERLIENVSEIVKNFHDVGGKAIINVGCNLSSSVKGKTLSESFNEIYFGIGFHPGEVEEFSMENFDKIKQLSSHEKCVCIGEIGLDYHFEPFDKNKQIESFIYQIEYADSVNLPISIHSRDATFNMINILKDNEEKLSSGAVMHCFSGSKETAKILLDLGVYISFGGTVTFKNAKNLQEIALYVPKDRMLTETDCPYLAPTPLRGTLNEPKNVKLVTEFLSNLRNEKLEAFEKQIEQNTLNLFTKIKV